MISKIKMLSVAVVLLPLISCSQTPKNDPFDDMLNRMNQQMERGIPQPDGDSLKPDKDGAYHYFSPDSSTHYYFRIDTSGNSMSRSFRFQFGPGGMGFSEEPQQPNMGGDPFQHMEEMMRQMEEMQRQFFGTSPFGQDPFGGGGTLPLFDEPLTPEEQQELRQQREYLSDEPIGDDEMLPEERMRMEEEQKAQSPAKKLHPNGHTEAVPPAEEPAKPVKKKIKTTKI
jgi:hypothetical protein